MRNRSCFILGYILAKVCHNDFRHTVCGYITDENGGKILDKEHPFEIADPVTCDDAQLILQFMKKPDVYLTDRETQVLGLLCQGLSMQEICKLCGISYDGLKKHNRNIYLKLGAKNRAEAERKAMQLGLIHRKVGEQ